jgi:hypothetical protein
MYLIGLLATLITPVVNAAPATGPLVVCPENPRYFMDTSTNKAVLLSGSHTWNNLQDIGPVSPPAALDYNAHLKWLKSYHFNFFRLWHFESGYWYKGGTTQQYIFPHPFNRPGPGTAHDGLPKFDLKSLNQDYFDRMRERVIQAQNEGFYVAVNFFQGIAAVQRDVEWVGHPFNINNNINRIDGDPNEDHLANEVHTLSNPDITEIQETYVLKVVNTLNDLDNVIWEIGNELWRGSRDFQYHMVNLIKNHEANTPGYKQHPVGVSTLCGYEIVGGSRKWYVAAPDVVFNDPKNPADWTTMSANSKFGWQNYKNDPPAATGHKVLLSDTDHLWGVGGNDVWVWKSFCRGLNPIFMDRLEESTWEPARTAMRDILFYTERVDLKKLLPQNSLCTTTYCLAEAGKTYIVYQPDRSDVFTVYGLKANEKYEYEWFNTKTGTAVEIGTVTPADAEFHFSPPFAAAVLYLNTPAKIDPPKPDSDNHNIHIPQSGDGSRK